MSSRNPNIDAEIAWERRADAAHDATLKYLSAKASLKAARKATRDAMGTTRLAGAECVEHRAMFLYVDAYRVWDARWDDLPAAQEGQGETS